jgi:hypothetical protein
MKRFGLAGKAVWAAGVLAAVLLCGRPAAASEPSKLAPSGRKAAGTAEKAAEKAQAAAEPEEKPSAPKQLDLGSPLVDDAKTLVKLDPALPVWLDKQNKKVVFLAASCRADWPLEFFATLRDRAYESVVVTDVRPSIVHTGLLLVGAKPGKPAQFDPAYTPPTGTRIDVEVRWKDKAGKVQKAPAQQWIRNIRTKKPMNVSWVFAGSGFRKDPETGRDRYLADGGDFITVLNLPTAMLDVPVESVRTMESRSYEGFVENMPAPGTPVTVVLSPAAALNATDAPAPRAPR